MVDPEVSLLFRNAVVILTTQGFIIYWRPWLTKCPSVCFKFKFGVLCSPSLEMWMVLKLTFKQDWVSCLIPQFLLSFREHLKFSRFSHFSRAGFRLSLVTLGLSLQWKFHLASCGFEGKRDLSQTWDRKNRFQSWNWEFLTRIQWVLGRKKRMLNFRTKMFWRLFFQDVNKKSKSVLNRRLLLS